jgi:hypothetical protein
MYLFSKDSLKTEKEIIFEHTELSHLYSTLPLAELSRLLPEKESKSGAPSWFDRKGLIGLLFLQSYTKLSGRQFIDHFNGNWFDFSVLTRPGSLAYGVLGGVSAPVLQGKRIKANHYFAMAANYEAYHTYQKSIYRGFSEVNTNISRIRNY